MVGGGSLLWSGWRGLWIRFDFSPQVGSVEGSIIHGRFFLRWRHRWVVFGDRYIRARTVFGIGSIDQLGIRKMLCILLATRN